jgi:hypothetical protein
VAGLIDQPLVHPHQVMFTLKRLHITESRSFAVMVSGSHCLRALIDQVQQIDARLSALEVIVQNLELSAEGWQEARIQEIETTQQGILDGTVTLEKVLAKNNITAYVDES